MCEWDGREQEGTIGILIMGKVSLEEINRF